MAENAQIDDDLFDRIHQAMLVRVTDKFPNVRIQAALAMTRLQQPEDPDCPTISGLFFFFLSFPSNCEFYGYTVFLFWTSTTNQAASSILILFFFLLCSIHVDPGK